MNFLIEVGVGGMGAAIVGIALTKHAYNRRLMALSAEEASLPVEVPDTCPKCGFAGTKADLNDIYALSDRPAFRTPVHTPRIIAMNSPEHLAHRCDDCGFWFRTAVKVP